MKRFVLPLVLLAGLTGCASNAPAVESVPSPSPTAVVMGPGTYEFQALSGGKGELSLPGKPAADLESLRAIVKGAPVTYITAEVDNREGDSDVVVDGVSLFTAEGAEVKYKTASDYADELDKLLPENAPAETYNRFVEAYNKHNDPVKSLAKGTVTLVGPDIPAEFVGVKIYDAYGDGVDALPKQ